MDFLNFEFYPLLHLERNMKNYVYQKVTFRTMR